MCTARTVAPGTGTPFWVRTTQSICTCAPGAALVVSACAGWSCEPGLPAVAWHTARGVYMQRVAPTAIQNTFGFIAHLHGRALFGERLGTQPGASRLVR